MLSRFHEQRIEPGRGPSTPSRIRSTSDTGDRDALPSHFGSGDGGLFGGELETEIDNVPVVHNFLKHATTAG